MPACHCAGNLAHEHYLAACGADGYGRTFVFGRRFRQIGGKEAAFVMAGEFHFAVNGKPVGVYVEYRHEYRHLNAAAFEIFRLVDFLHGHHSAVGARHHGIDGVAREVSAGRAEEVHHQQDEHTPDCGGDNGYGERTHPDPQGHVEHCH